MSVAVFVTMSVVMVGGCSDAAAEDAAEVVVGVIAAFGGDEVGLRSGGQENLGAGKPDGVDFLEEGMSEDGAEEPVRQGAAHAHSRTTSRGPNFSVQA